MINDKLICFYELYFDTSFDQSFHINSIDALIHHLISFSDNSPPTSEPHAKCPLQQSVESFTTTTPALIRGDTGPPGDIGDTVKLLSGALDLS